MFFDFFWTDYVVDVLHFIGSQDEKEKCVYFVSKIPWTDEQTEGPIYCTAVFDIIFISTSLQRRKIGKGFARFQFQSSTFSNNVKLAKEDGARMETIFIICKIRYQCFRHEMSCSHLTYIY